MSDVAGVETGAIDDSILQGSPLGYDVACLDGMANGSRLVYLLRSTPYPDHYYIGLTSDIATKLATRNSG